MYTEPLYSHRKGPRFGRDKFQPSVRMEMLPEWGSPETRFLFAANNLTAFISPVEWAKTNLTNGERRVGFYLLDDVVYPFEVGVDINGRPTARFALPGDLHVNMELHVALVKDNSNRVIERHQRLFTPDNTSSWMLVYQVVRQYTRSEQHYCPTGLVDAWNACGRRVNAAIRRVQQRMFSAPSVIEEQRAQSDFWHNADWFTDVGGQPTLLSLSGSDKVSLQDDTPSVLRDVFDYINMILNAYDRSDSLENEPFPLTLTVASYKRLIAGCRARFNLSGPFNVVLETEELRDKQTGWNTEGRVYLVKQGLYDPNTSFNHQPINTVTIARFEDAKLIVERLILDIVQANESLVGRYFAILDRDGDVVWATDAFTEMSADTELEETGAEST